LTRNKDNEAKKLCIELDEWMGKEWEEAKGISEYSFTNYNLTVSLTDREVLMGLLFCFDMEYYSADFPNLLDDEETTAMVRRAHLKVEMR